MEVPAMDDPRPPRGVPNSEASELGRLAAALVGDLTHHVLTFFRARVTPLAERVALHGGDPGDVVFVAAETLRSIADGLEGQP